MAKPVNGYLAEDGTFFDDFHAARRHDAVNRIRGLCESHMPQPINSIKFLKLLDMWSAEIKEYIDVQESINQIKEDTTGVNRDQADNTDGNVEADALEQLASSGYVSMPDVGDSAQGESVQQRRKKHGPRSRGNDA